ncbi:arylesterase [Dyadobacter sp. CY345]|uniref:arylesterase n=1 Tax=Dyadobacter sp. CY345 TaxID=2909335 RepID=UPI001F2133DE|nr:arylesterase [Dyadobacter sp. CY345]MCF2447185.1 arylesterase [Dyadobacter sp. CY345]
MNSIFSITRVFVLVMLITACNSNKKTEPTQNDSTANEKVVEKKTTKTILFFGNSLTAAYGLDDPTQGFAGLTQKRIDSLGLNYKVVNAGVSGETSAGGNSRIDWNLKQPVDVFILELGGNDGLRGIPVTETKKNLQAILDKVKTKYPDAKLVLAGMQMPPSMGKTYTTEFRNVYPELAKKNNLTLIPFLLENVGGEAKLNLPDGIHPTEEGHKIVAETVWNTLKDIL